MASDEGTASSKPLLTRSKPEKAIRRARKNLLRFPPSKRRRSKGVQSVNKKVAKFVSQQIIIFNTNRNSSSVVKALLAHWPNGDAYVSRLGVYLPLMSSCLLKPLNPLIGYESHIQYVVFSVVVTNQQPLSTVQRVNKIRRLTIVYRFYFTQCVCTGSIERLTLSLNISIMYS